MVYLLKMVIFHGYVISHNQRDVEHEPFIDLEP